MSGRSPEGSPQKRPCLGLDAPGHTNDELSPPSWVAEASLHDQITALATYASLSADEEQTRQHLMTICTKTVRKVWPDAQLTDLGPYAAGEPNWFKSEMNLCVKIPLVNDAMVCARALCAVLRGINRYRDLEVRDDLMGCTLSFVDANSAITVNMNFGDAGVLNQPLPMMFEGLASTPISLLNALLVTLRVICWQRHLNEAANSGGYVYLRLSVLLGKFLTENPITDLGESLRAFMQFCASRFDYSHSVHLKMGASVCFWDMVHVKESFEKLSSDCSAATQLTRWIEWRPLCTARRAALQCAEETVTSLGITAAPIQKVTHQAPVATNKASVSEAYRNRYHSVDAEIVLSFSKQVQWHAVLDVQEDASLGFRVSSRNPQRLPAEEPALALECEQGHRRCSGDCAVWHKGFAKFLQKSRENRSSLPPLRKI